MDFKKPKIIFENDRPNWKNALSNTKGIYVISNTSNGKMYVDKTGVWNTSHKISS